MVMQPSISSITIFRQMGSLGLEIGQQVARQLGFRLVWRDLVNAAAKRAGAPEMALAAIDDLGLLSECASTRTCKAYRQALRELMLEKAAKGRVVMIGRAGQVVLRGYPEVLHVQIMAPFQVRVERVARRQAISLECAQAQVEASDHSRRSFLRRFYHARWDDPELYDISINTARVSASAAADLICRSVEHRVEPAAYLTMPTQEYI